MEWEANWIRINLARYDSPMHAEAVIRNIEKRYLINSLQKKINKLEEELESEEEIYNLSKRCKI